MVTDLRVAVRVRTGSSTRTAPSSPGHWANADGVNALLAASFGAAAAWGIVVGTLNVLMTMFKRTKRNKLLNQIRGHAYLSSNAEDVARQKRPHA